MHRSDLLAFSVGVLAGAALWALSPLIGGQLEPWDASLYYGAALMLAGLLAALIAPKPRWVLYAGSVGGQALYALLALPTGPLLPVGLGFLLVWSLLFVGGAYIGARIRARIGRVKA